ncbi:MAG: transcriptional regulator [Blastocatellia bacterium]|nr:transcriptional regulator [Blastocatellia bacterium]
MTAVPKKINRQKYGQLLQETLPRVIRNDKELEAMLEIVNRLISKKRGPEEDELFLLVSSLVETYENEQYAIEPLPPLEFLKQIMADRKLKQKDIVPVLGSQGITSEVLNGKREISKTQARRLADFFNVSVEHFI